MITLALIKEKIFPAFLISSSCIGTQYACGRSPCHSIELHLVTSPWALQAVIYPTFSYFIEVSLFSIRNWPYSPMRTNQDSRDSRYSILSNESSTPSQSNASQPVNNESIPQETRGSNRKIGVTYCIQYQETIRYQSNNSQESIDRNISCFENVLTRQEFDLRSIFSESCGIF